MVVAVPPIAAWLDDVHSGLAYLTFARVAAVLGVVESVVDLGDGGLDVDLERTLIDDMRSEDGVELGNLHVGRVGLVCRHTTPIRHVLGREVGEDTKDEG